MRRIRKTISVAAQFLAQPAVRENQGLDVSRKARTCSRASMRQGGLAPAQKGAHGRVALEADRNLISLARFIASGGSGQQLGARRPVRLIFGESHISEALQDLDRNVRPSQLGDRKRPIDRDDR